MLGLPQRLQKKKKLGWDDGTYMVNPERWGLISKRGKSGLWRIMYS
jgi:hypothetical protein